MSVTCVISDMRSSVISWNVSLALILIATSHEKSSQRLLTLGIRCVCLRTSLMNQSTYRLITVSVPYLRRIQAHRIASMASMSIHCPRTPQSSWAFSAMLLRSSMTNFFSDASFFRFVLIVLKLVQIRCERISPREVAVYNFEV